MTVRRLATLFLLALPAPAGLAAQSGLQVAFGPAALADFPGAPPPDLSRVPFTAGERATIEREVADVAAEVRTSFPRLPTHARITVVRVDRDLGVVGGVSGRAQAPGEILVEVSTSFEGGLEAQVSGLRHTLFHELHHLARGWTIQENRFGPGIAIAAVNEGLAEVFAEERTGQVLPASEYPAEASDWAAEIADLPVDADYGAWMFQHPDGRAAIGYRTGRWIVHRAMEASGMDVVELSAVPPARILELAEVSGGAP